MTKKKIILLTAACAVVVAAGFVLWKCLAAPTRIAFVNYQAITLGQISKANDNSFVKIEELPAEELDKAGKYDMVMVNGMGLRITDEQRQALSQAADAGTPVLTSAATNPDNQINSVDSVDYEYLKQYLTGGHGNYRNMLRYVRRFIDGKKLFAPIPGDPFPAASSLLYYPSEEDELNFNSVAEYEAWLRKEGKWREGAPRIILTGQMGVPDSLVKRLEATGNMVYPAAMPQTLINKGHADSIHASAIINMAHGRMGDEVTDWLRNRNIPLFSTVNANRDYKEWMADKMGMNGGFLSQSIVTPEIDGAIRPFTLFAHFTGRDGLPGVEAIPDRLTDFVATVNNYISLQRKDNKNKKVAIFYFKGPGQSSMVAEGMDVAPSLYNLLVKMKEAGYTVTGLPSSAAGLEQMIKERGRIFNGYATGAMEEFVKTSGPQIVGKGDYDKWRKAALSEKMSAQVDSVDGAFPGHGLSDGRGNLALARLDFGNVVLIPQPAAGLGDDDFKMVHGTDAAPPHQYVGAYLWARYGFKADALVHFGAHGSLEFTPRKQVALGNEDWPDRLVGTLPHVYVYSTSNVGEAMTAKRRSYAGIVNYLTPPFMESNVRGIYKDLSDVIAAYNKAPGDAAAARVKALTLKLGIHRELRIDSLKPFTADDIARIESFAEELANEKITGALYVMGVPYAPNYIQSTLKAMTVDPIAYSLQKLHGGDLNAWRTRAIALVESNAAIDDAAICNLAGITQAQLDSARNILHETDGSRDMLSRMMVMGAMMPPEKQQPLKIADRKAPKKKHSMIPGMSPEKALAMARKMGADEASLKKMESAMKAKKAGARHGKSKAPQGPAYSKQQLERALAVGEVEHALTNIAKYRDGLVTSPAAELASILNALSGGFITPTPGGDPVLNPGVLPTGRNMFAVNAEETPSLAAWEKGKELADNTLEMYRKAHGDSLPRKVSYTLWSSEFIETEGATIAQVLYMLGVEPVRDSFGRVTDLRLIPSAELGRPRVDVVVQTSGQLRDLAASRLFLISRAVKMAAEAKDDKYPNFVAEGVVASEKHLVDKGVSPKEAREMSTSRVFGGVNGNYGTGIQAMVEAGDRWESDKEIAETYLNNMGASYGSEEDWEQTRQYAFEAALTRTDVVVQPRQSNTWGALSLDHVYEFMGGMDMAVRNVTGKDPDAYLSDYRNRSHAKMQEVKEAIGIESRTTILNPTYIKEKMKGGAADAAAVSDVVKNTYGWNVMKPDAIDNELWDEIYNVYVQDKFGLGVQDYFERQNPAALEEMTAVMMETARKGMWDASAEQLKAIAELHTKLVDKYKPSCSGAVCNNAKLREFIASKTAPDAARRYERQIRDVREASLTENKGTVLKKEEMNASDKTRTIVSNTAVAVLVLVAITALVWTVRRHRKKMEE